MRSKSQKAHQILGSFVIKKPHECLHLKIFNHQTMMKLYHMEKYNNFKFIIIQFSYH